MVIGLCDDVSPMRTRLQAVVLPSEIGEFAGEVRRIFQELGGDSGGQNSAGECSPAVDVFETDEIVEIAMDLPGVEPSAMQIVIKADTVLIAGRKAARRAEPSATFHLVERSLGRFARIIRLVPPCNMGQAHARLVDGQLTITIPKIEERRGAPIVVPIDPADPRK